MNRPYQRILTATRYMWRPVSPLNTRIVFNSARPLLKFNYPGQAHYFHTNRTLNTRNSSENNTNSVGNASSSSSSSSSSNGDTKSSEPLAWKKSTLNQEPETKVTKVVYDDNGNLLKLEITAAAADKLKEVKVKKPLNEVLRVKVESGGCHGFQYLFSMHPQQEITSEDGVFERNGSIVVADKQSLLILKNCTVDYVTELIGSQFKVNSDNAKSSCGCGTSFSVDPDN